MGWNQEEGDQEGRQNIRNNILTIPPSPQKPAATSTVIMDKNSETNDFAARTPEKASHSQPLHNKFSAAQVEHLQSQSYKAITEVFDAVISSLRLLSLRKKLPTFQNICNQVQVLVKREISCGQLAQMKYFLPEAIHFDKILVHDKKTLCMKQDIVIVLLFDVTAGHSKQSDYIALRQIFSDRLINYFTEHPEAQVIPEAILPDLFNKSKQTALGDKTSDFRGDGFPKTFSQLCETTGREQVLPDSLIEDPPDTLSKSSHLNPSFCRHFSRKDSDAEEERSQPVLTPFPFSHEALHYPNSQDGKAIAAKEFCSLSSQMGTEASLEITSQKAQESSCTYSNPTLIGSTSVQLIRPKSFANSDSYGSPLSNLASATDSLTIETPAQSTPKQAVPSSDDKHKAMASQRQTLSFKPAKRYLDFSCLKSSEHVLDSVVDKSECYNSQKGHIPVPLCGSSAPLQKVAESHGCATEQRTSGCLPDLVSLIHNIFESTNYCPITKEELVYRIIINGLDLTESREVEEQIEILEKLVPDWIFQKLAPSGDALYSIRKMSALDSVQARVTGR